MAHASDLSSQLGKKQRRYWVVSPNVRNDPRTVSKWIEASVREQAAFMGWGPNDYEHGQIGAKFAGNAKYGVMPNDVILIARRHRGEPEVVGFGVVRGNHATRLDGFTPPQEFGSMRKLSPFQQWSAPPSNIPIREILRHTKSLVQLHPDDNDVHRKVCSWMERHLGKKSSTGKQRDITEGNRAPKRQPIAPRILFARIGRMHAYAGPVAGDERPIGGGDHNKTEVGHEIYNFQEAGGRLYGYFQPTMSSQTVALERIEVGATSKKSLSDVLVIFVARRKAGGQTVVGWYRHAQVFREKVERSPGKPHGYGHFASAMSSDCVLLPDDNREWEVPKGKGGMGQSNVCYPLERDGTPKHANWMQRIVDFIDDYQGSDILATPEVAAEKESAAATEKALARANGQGFARTQKERKALEDHSMAAAERFFRNKGFTVEDVSKRRSYDLLCIRGKRELHVEVKGTTTSGATVVLTNNEVKHACDKANACILFVFHSIKLEKEQASGGKAFVLDPWRLKQENLTPVTYTYRI